MIEQKYINRFHTYYVISETTNCWQWTGTKDRDGYGVIGIKENEKFKLIKAHRLSALIYGLDMSNPIVRHTCNNPSCVNPEHLITGSHQDNMDDKIRCNRQSKGAEHGAAKLTEKDVLAIRAKYIPRIYSTTRLAAEYKVNRTTIFNIISKKHWKHI